MSRWTLLIFGLLTAGAVQAAITPGCLWDRDTRAMERQRFPSVLEVITGKFLRHSDEYYRWRVEDRRARLGRGEAGAELVDDLAVAHSKLGDDRRAIALMGELLEEDPRRYETLANLGTFHVHAGDLEEGAGFIARALEVNPDAHFGRERYQLLVVEYLQGKEARAGEGQLPLCRASVSQPGGSLEPNFWTFLAGEVGADPRLPHEHAGAIDAAVRGVTGMLRFGNHRSPVLLEVLSDLLLADFQRDAKGLAARALLRAADGCQDAGVAAAYLEKAREALSFQTPESGESRSLRLEELEEQLALELAEADTWWASLLENELRWIDSGEDVDARFAEAYYSEPSIESGGGGRGAAVPVLLGLAAAVISAALVLLARRRSMVSPGGAGR
jgi:tetratricopeptide (TPR) repeat protein